MLYNKFSVLILLFLFVNQVSTQTIKYEPLLNQAPLPTDLTRSPWGKYQQYSTQNNARGTADEQVAESFLLETTYLFDNLLRSGYIVYNDPLGQYVNDVLQVVLEANPNLTNKEPRVYIFKSTEVNAFAVDQGIIFVSLGLLAQLNNEAQLAFILSHELVHIAKVHALDGFLEANRIEQAALKKDIADNQDIDLTTIMKNSYSRDQEIEADSYGTNYFLQTNYSYEGLAGLFNILRYSHMPYAEIKFELSSLEKGTTLLPRVLELDTVTTISVPEENEEESTHPAINKRVELLRDRLKQENTINKQINIISEERFNYCRQRARMELPLLHLKQQELPHAIYTAYLLEKTYGENDYNQEVIGKALYGITKFKNNEEWNNLDIPSWKKIEGEAQQLFYLIRQLSSQELNVLALAYNYDLYSRQTENESLRAIIIDLFAELHLNHDIESVDFFKATDEREQVVITTSNEEEEATIEQGETEERGEKRAWGKRIKHDPDWQYYVFMEALNDTLFQKVSTDGFAYGKDRAAEIAFYDRSTREGRKNSRQANRRRRNRGASLGIHKAILLNPVYMQFAIADDRMKIDYQQSEENEALATEVLNDLTTRLDIDFQLLDADELASNDAETFNDIIVAKEWLSNQLDNDGFIYHGYNKTEMMALTQKYDTPYVVTLMIITGKLEGGGKTESFLLFAVFDSRNGRSSILKSKIMSRRMNKTYLQSELYDALFQLSKTR